MMEAVVGTQLNVFEAVDFVTTNMPIYRGRERQVEKVIKGHLKYNTLGYGIDDYGIQYLCRYNINEDMVATVLDLIIRKDLRRSKGLIRFIISKEWTKFPSLKSIKFERELKHNKGFREYKLINFFKAR